MFGEVFRFELRYQLTRKSTWLYLLVVNALLLQLTKEAFFDQAREGGWFYNAPLVISTVCLFGSVLGVIIAAAIVGDAATRDVSSRMAPLVYSTPIGRFAYLGGRFLAAFAVIAGLMVSVPLFQLLALALPGLDPALIGPFRPAAYVLGYASLLLPTTFIMSALMFSAAILSRRAMAAFAAGAVLFVWALFSNLFVAQAKSLWVLARPLDPFALTVMTELSRTRTALQKGQMLIGLEPALLANRGLWIAIACAALAYAYSRFAFAHESGGARWRWLPRRSQRAVVDPMDARGQDVRDSDPARSAHASLPQVSQRADPAARWRQVAAITARSFKDIVFARGFLIVVAVWLLLVATGPEFMEHLDGPLVPVTGFIGPMLTQSADFFGFVPPLMCILYAGELVWRERDAGLGPIVDATPLNDWVPLLGKGLGLALALATWQGALMAAGILTQLRMGQPVLQPVLWLQMLFGLGLPTQLLFAVLAITLHVVVNQKYAAHLAALAAYVVMQFSSQVGIEHHLFVYGADTGWNYSDMRGFGTTLAPVLWFKLYWAGWALLLAVVARLLWVRGSEQSLRQRLAIARTRFSGLVAAMVAAGVALVLGAGGFIFYNINVLNEYMTAAQRDAQRAAYEKRYASTAGEALPTLSSRRLHIELYPERSMATIAGHDTYFNRTSGPITTLHVETSAAVTAGPLRFDRPAMLVKDDAEFHHRIVRLATPLQPGEALGMDYDLRFAPHGFSNEGVDDHVAPRASHFEQDWLPVLGYQRGRELNDEAKRRAAGLSKRPEITPLTDVAARYDLRGAARINVDTTIGTAADQVAVAPGQLRRSWAAGGRRYFRYGTDAPMRGEFGIYSAHYAVQSARWHDVAIRVYYHPTHGANVPRMIRGVQDSLDRYTRVFGPYPAPQLTVVEAADFEISLHAHPTSVRFYEGYAIMNADADRRGVDMPFAVMAHEMAHQWWGNQVTPAAVAGAPFVAESLAWYSALGVIADAKGAAEEKRFLDVMRADYRAPHARDGAPLLESADWFTAYRLGPFAMVALREAIGQERVNLALRRFLQKYGDGQAPLPTSLELYAELKAVTPPDRQAFLTDLLARNTFWNLSTKSVSAVPAGKAWRVTLEVVADKVSVDKQGKETMRPISEPIEIGVYGPATGDAPGATLYLAKHQLHSGAQRVTVTVPSPPASAGIDPRNILIDTMQRDNVMAVPKGS